MARSLVEELQILIKDTANNNPAPKICTISDIYADGNVDVKTNIGGMDSTIPYRPCIGSPTIGDEALIVFIDGNINGGYVICNGGGEAQYNPSSSFGVQVDDGVLTVTGTDTRASLDFTGITSDEIIVDKYAFKSIDDQYDFGVEGAFDVVVHVGDRHAHLLIEDGKIASEILVESESLEIIVGDGIVTVNADEVSFEVFGINQGGDIILGQATTTGNGECTLELDCITDGEYSVTAKTPYRHGHVII